MSGVLGRWIEIGAADAHTTQDRTRIGASRTTRTRSNDAIYVKVQRLD